MATYHLRVTFVTITWCFRRRDKAWRDSHILVFPALGNHEFIGDSQLALENWWRAFPETRNRRWYSVQLGSRVYLLALDSDASLLPGSDQARWIEKQVNGLPPSIDFVIVTLHHPPVADVQEHIRVEDKPRPNEIALRDYVSTAARTKLRTQRSHPLGHFPLRHLAVLGSFQPPQPVPFLLAHPDSFHPSALRLSIGIFYLAQLGTSHLAATAFYRFIEGLTATIVFPIIPTGFSAKKGSLLRVFR
jgi:hypothetical protein